MLATPPNFLSYLFAFSLLRLPAVLQLVGDKRTKFYEDLAAGLWPQPVSINSRSVAWPAAEIAAVNAARIAGATGDEIRVLVTELQAVRKDAPKLVADLYFADMAARSAQGFAGVASDGPTGLTAKEEQ